MHRGRVVGVEADQRVEGEPGRDCSEAGERRGARSRPAKPDSLVEDAQEKDERRRVVRRIGALGGEGVVRPEAESGGGRGQGQVAPATSPKEARGRHASNRTATQQATAECEERQPAHAEDQMPGLLLDRRSLARNRAGHAQAGIQKQEPDEGRERR